MSDVVVISGDDERDRIRKQVVKALGSSGSTLLRFLLSAVGGAIPLIGSGIGAAAAAWGEEEQSRVNDLLNVWLKLQEQELREIGVTLLEVIARIDSQDQRVRERVESPEYVALVRKALRDWAGAESEEKRRLIRNLLANAAGAQLTTDDVVRLFIEWIRMYSEAHFKLIRMVHQHSGWTRYQIWQEMYGQRVREDSAEADLFKLLVHDLSIGHVIRQERETDASGNFIKTHAARRPQRTPYLKSAFDDEKPYELTELGRQFVHYTMNEIVPKLGSGGGSSVAR